MDSARADRLAARRQLDTLGWIARNAETYRHLPPPAAQAWLGEEDGAATGEAAGGDSSLAASSAVDPGDSSLIASAACGGAAAKEEEPVSLAISEEIVDTVGVRISVRVFSGPVMY